MSGIYIFIISYLNEIVLFLFSNIKYYITMIYIQSKNINFI